MDTISNLSRNERKMLVNKKFAEEILNQTKSLKIDMSYDDGGIRLENFEYLIQLSNKLMFTHRKFTNQECILQQIAYQKL